MTLGRAAETPLRRAFSPLFHGPIRLDQSFVAAFEREHVPVTHPLGHGSGKDAAVSTSTVHDDLAVLVRNGSFQVSLQNAFAEVHRFGGMTTVPFAVFTHVHQQGIRVGGKPRPGLLDR